LAPALLLAAGCNSQSGQTPAEGGAAAGTAANMAGQTAADTPNGGAAATSHTGSSGGSAVSSGAKSLSAEEHVARALDFSAKGRRREAIADYTAALKQQPRLLSALLYRAGEYYARQEFDAAEKDLAQALSIDPKYAEAYILRAHLWGVKHDYEKAVDDFYTALKHPEREANFAKYFGDGKDAVAHVYLAAAYSECPDVSFRNDAKAFEHALKACQVDGWKNRRYVYLLVSAIAGSKNQDAALKRQETAVAAAPNEEIKEQLQGAVEAFERRSEFPLR
jgi:tetratricopeptide (TPR) repeat protein